VKAPLAHESARDQPPATCRKTNARRTAPVEEPEEEEVPNLVAEEFFASLTSTRTGPHDSLRGLHRGRGYLSGQLIYHLRDLLLLGLVGGFVTLILNPVVVSLQHWGVKRRGGAVALSRSSHS